MVVVITHDKVLVCIVPEKRMRLDLYHSGSRLVFACSRFRLILSFVSIEVL
jgi:hypothetical protein